MFKLGLKRALVKVRLAESLKYARFKKGALVKVRFAVNLKIRKWRSSHLATWQKGGK